METEHTDTDLNTMYEITKGQLEKQKWWKIMKSILMNKKHNINNSKHKWKPDYKAWTKLNTVFKIKQKLRSSKKHNRNSNRRMTKVSFSETFLIFKGRNKKLTSLFVLENFMLSARQWFLVLIYQLRRPMICRKRSSGLRKTLNVNVL